MLKSVIAGTFLFYFSFFAIAQEHAIYQDSKQPINVRVQDLLARMTPAEKIAQLQTLWQKKLLLQNSQGQFTAEHAPELLADGIGEIARPSENTQRLQGKTALQTAEFTNAVQTWLKQNTRLGIPVIFHEEALHGFAGRDATSFPQAIGLASTWDPDLLTQIYAATAAEIRPLGVQRVLAPVVDVARDPRWGRIEETLGEDPYLVASLGTAIVKGFQGDAAQPNQQQVMATLKHLVGHGEPTGGLNTAPTPIGESRLHEIFLFPFEAVIKSAHPHGVMASYNEIDGLPSHANGKILNDILRKSWGFNGTVVSDYYGLELLMTGHHIAATKADAALLAINAGVNLETPDRDVYTHLNSLIANKQLSIAQLDAAVTPILQQKFALGLFENPYVSTSKLATEDANRQHRTLAQKAAEEALVLLKNDQNILPLNIRTLNSIAVIGPHANETLLGGYSDVPKTTVSILQGIQEYVGKKIPVHYAKGVKITADHWQPGADSIAANSFSKDRWYNDKVELAKPEDNKTLIAEAVAVAQKSDVAVVVIGENEAISREGWAPNHLGDRTDLNLVGQQQDLVDAILAIGKPVIVILNNGRPLSISKIAQTAPAIIEAWYAGQETGRAVARILFGDVNPGGKLPVSIARTVGQLPVYYNHKPSAKRGYLFEETQPLFPFGYGLSYTQFSYSDITLDKTSLRAGEKIKISAKIKNTGIRAGDEIVQLYIQDPVASLTRPVKELKGFKRLTIKPKQTVTVTFELAANQLGFYNQDLRYVLEPGVINVQIGSSSQHIHLQGSFTIEGDVRDITEQKVFLTQASSTLIKN